MDASWRTIGDPHAYGGEGRRQRSLGFPCASGARVATLRWRALFSRWWIADRGDGACAAALRPATGIRPARHGSDRLSAAWGFRPPTPGRARRALGGKRRGQAIACIRQHRRKPNTRRMRSISASAISLRPRRPPSLGHAGLRHPTGVTGPAFRQKQAQADHHRNLVPRQRQRHQASGNWRSCRAPRRIAVPTERDALSSAVPCRR